MEKRLIEANQYIKENFENQRMELAKLNIDLIIEVNMTSLNIDMHNYEDADGWKEEVSVATFTAIVKNDNNEESEHRIHIFDNKYEDTRMVICNTFMIENHFSDIDENHILDLVDKDFILYHLLKLISFDEFGNNLFYEISLEINQKKEAELLVNSKPWFPELKSFKYTGGTQILAIFENGAKLTLILSELERQLKFLEQNKQK